MVTRKPEEELLLALLGIAAVGLAVRKAGGFWSETLGPWAVEHGVQIAAGAGPLVTVLIVLAATWARNIAGAFARQRQARAGHGQ